MPDDEQLVDLSAQIDALEAFPQILWREYQQLEADVVSVLVSLGGSVRVRSQDRQAPLSGTIDRAASSC